MPEFEPGPRTRPAVARDQDRRLHVGHAHAINSGLSARGDPQAAGIVRLVVQRISEETSMAREVSRHLVPEVGERRVRHLRRAYQVIDAAYCAAGEVVRAQDDAHAVRSRVAEELVEQAQVEGRERAVQIMLKALPLDGHADEVEPLAMEVVKLPSVGETLGIDAGVDIVDPVGAWQIAAELATAQVHPELLARRRGRFRSGIRCGGMARPKGRYAQ